MKRRVVTLSLMLILAFSLCAPSAFAAADRILGFGSEDSIDAMNDFAQELYDDYGIEVYYAYSDSLSGMTLQECAQDTYDKNAADANGILLLDCKDADHYYLYRSGTAKELITDEDAQSLCTAYSAGGDTYGESINAYYLMAREILARVVNSDAASGMVITPSGMEMPAERQLPLVVDNADAISEDELSRLNEHADSVSEANKCDVAVVFVADTSGMDTERYAFRFYEQNGYGYGSNDDGVMLLIDVNARQFRCIGHSFGAYAFTDAGQEYAQKAYLPYLSDSDWAGAAEAFISVADTMLQAARGGQPIDVDNMPKEPFSPLWVVVDIIVGFLLALIPVGVMKRQLKSVENNDDASHYLKRDSFRLTRSNDVFIRRFISKTPRPKNNDSNSGSGGGTSFTTSDSGRSYSSSGGSF